MYKYKTKNVCSRSISFDINDDIVSNIRFEGGCAGNTAGVAKLANGRSVDEVIELLSGIQCRMGTSCPDQLAKALLEYKINN